MKPRFALDPRELEAFLAKLDPRCELIYRVAMRGLCCGDQGSEARTKVLMTRFKDDLGDVFEEAGELAHEMLTGG
jgi:hypothetical protein